MYFLGDIEDRSASRQRFLAIYRALRERIALLHYPPGTTLVESELTAEFEVSRTPIRRVLQRLEYEGLVVSRHGVGTYVSDIPLEGLREVLELRASLAELIGRLSPNAPGAEEAAALQAVAGRIADLRGRRDIEAFGRANIAVHETVLGVIGNPALAQITDSLFYQSTRMWYRLLPELDWAHEVDLLRGDVEALAEAMRAGDAAAVGFIMRNAISMVAVRLGPHIRAEQEALPS